MKKLFVFTLVIAGLLFQLASCDSPEQKQLKKIASLEDEFYNDLTGVISREKALALVNAYVDFATQNPDHEMAAEYLFRAGDVSMNTGYPERAIDIYNQVHREYPTFSRRPESLFLIGFILENQLMNYTRAEHIYKQFIELYPDHDLANDAEILLQHLGKSPDELVREFEEQLRQQEGS